MPSLSKIWIFLVFFLIFLVFFLVFLSFFLSFFFLSFLWVFCTSAGASLVQLYSAFSLQGPVLIPRIKSDLAALLRRDGFASVAEAVGAAHRPLHATERVSTAAAASKAIA